MYTIVTSFNKINNTYTVFLHILLGLSSQQYCSVGIIDNIQKVKEFVWSHAAKKQRNQELFPFQQY